MMPEKTQGKKMLENWLSLMSTLEEALNKILEAPKSDDGVST
jgi:hypothetical protein